jgi:serine/threonine protein phosphatase PrpC
MEKNNNKKVLPQKKIINNQNNNIKNLFKNNIINDNLNIINIFNKKNEEFNQMREKKKISQNNIQINISQKRNKKKNYGRNKSLKYKKLNSLEYKKILQFYNENKPKNEHNIIVIADKKIISSTSGQIIFNEKKPQITKDKISVNKNKKSQKLYFEFSYSEYPNISNREKMEDFHTIIPSLNSNPKISYFSIFDGHSGEEVAKYCQLHLHEMILKILQSNNFNIEKTLNISFQKIDEEISKKNFPNESGTTVTILLIYENNLNEKFYACANVGDSKCYLIKKNSILKLTKEHKCNDKEEVERIKKNGGLVFNKRVFGSLMLTRSIGDREMKNYGVSSIPFININKIVNKIYFLLLLLMVFGMLLMKNI